MTERDWSKHSKGGFLFDVLGRIKEWKCPRCGDRFGANLQEWPKSTTDLWAIRYKHLKEHEKKDGRSSAAIQQLRHGPSRGGGGGVKKA